MLYCMDSYVILAVMITHEDYRRYSRALMVSVYTKVDRLVVTGQLYKAHEVREMVTELIERHANEVLYPTCRDRTMLLPPVLKEDCPACIRERVQKKG